MPTQDKVAEAEQHLIAIAEVIAAEDYITAAAQVQVLQQNLLQIFAEPTAVGQNDASRLQKLAVDFFALVSTLSNQRQQIKDSIAKFAAVKSVNKIRKTYKID